MLIVTRGEANYVPIRFLLRDCLPALAGGQKFAS
jgi:hypothetical protein